MVFSIPSDEIRDSLKGAWRILRGDAAGMDDFNVTTEGFWRSFQVIFLMAAPMGIRFLADRQAYLESHKIGLEEFPSAAFSFATVVGVGVDWVLMPILLILAANFLGIKERYAHYVIARNWASFISASLFAIPALLYLTGIASLLVTAFMDLALLGFILFYSYRICRVGLKADIPLALGIVIFDFFLSLFLGQMLYTSVGL